MKAPVCLLFSLALAAVSSLAAQPVPPVPPTPPAPPVSHFWAGEPAAGSFLGVGVAEISGGRARSLNLKEEYGVEITRVEEDSPAGKAGIKAGDVVLEFNGQRVEGIEQFQRLVRETPAGRTVKLLVSRNGANQTLTAAIGARKSPVLMKGNAKDLFGPDGFQMPVLPDMPNVFTGIRSSLLGVEVESLGPQLAEYFGAKDGVLVRAVTKGSPADKAGMKAGDVITKVDQKTVASPGELSRAARAAHAEKTLPLQVVRDRREMTITVTLE